MILIISLQTEMHMQKNFDVSGSLARMKAQATIAVSRLVGEAKLQVIIHLLYNQS